MFVDIGLNLSSDRFDEDRPDILRRAREAAVQRCILTGTNLAGSETVVRMAREYPGCHATVGIHPHDASSWDKDTLPALRHLLNQPGVVAVGETGLDFNRNYSPPAAQEKAFLAQISLAAETGLPLFLHERDASERMITLLRHTVTDWKTGVLHCFTGNRAVLHAYLDMGLLIGITGWICDERRGQELRELVREIPADRLLLETDAPWLLPRDLPSPPKSRRNEPAFLPHIAAAVAALRDESLETVAECTTRNAERLFRLPRPMP